MKLIRITNTGTGIQEAINEDYIIRVFPLNDGHAAIVYQNGRTAECINTTSTVEDIVEMTNQ